MLIYLRCIVCSLCLQAALLLFYFSFSQHYDVEESPRSSSPVFFFSLQSAHHCLPQFQKTALGHCVKYKENQHILSAIEHKKQIKCLKWEIKCSILWKLCAHFDFDSRNMSQESWAECVLYRFSKQWSFGNEGKQLLGLDCCRSLVWRRIRAAHQSCVCFIAFFISCCAQVFHFVHFKWALVQRKRFIYY